MSDKPAFYPRCERKHIVRVHDNGYPCAVCVAEDKETEAPPVIALEPTEPSVHDRVTAPSPEPKPEESIQVDPLEDLDESFWQGDK